MTLITVSGYPGSGTTTVVGLLQSRLDLKAFNIGDIFRMMAAERGISLQDLHLLAKSDRSIDRELDDRQVDVARRGNVILEGRLAGFLTHQAGLAGTRVWLAAPFDVRTTRVARREAIPLSQAQEEVRVREEAERTRYQAFYGFDLDDHSVYDMMIDSEHDTAEAIAQSIAEHVAGGRND